MKKVGACLLSALLAAVMALVYQIFIFENSFAPAGINGIATIIQYKLGISVGYMSLIVNIPLLILAFIFLSREFALRTSIFLFVFSGILLILRYQVIDLSFLSYSTENGTSTILAPIAAGVINGGIYGVMLRINGCTGGLDIVSALIHKTWPEQNLVWINFTLNCIIAGVSYFVYDFNIEPVVLCIIYCYLSSTMGDRMIRGSRARVKFEIITPDFDRISTEIISELRHTATVVPARGMFSGKETDLLICVVQKHQVAEMEKIIARHPGTFAYASMISETLGNYKDIRYNLLHGGKKKEKEQLA